MFFDPLSIAITSLGEERANLRANLRAFRAFGRFALFWVLFVSSSSWCQGRAAVSDCCTRSPWTFLLPFFSFPITETLVFPQPKHWFSHNRNVAFYTTEAFVFPKLKHWFSHNSRVSNKRNIVFSTTETFVLPQPKHLFYQYRNTDFPNTETFVFPQQKHWFSHFWNVSFSTIETIQTTKNQLCGHMCAIWSNNSSSQQYKFCLTGTFKFQFTQQ